MDAQQEPQEVEEAKAEETQWNGLDVATCVTCGNEAGWRFGEVKFVAPDGTFSLIVCNSYRCNFCGHVYADNSIEGMTPT